MKFTFDISELEILSILTFDPSIDFSDLQNIPINGQIEFNMERSTIENVYN